MSTRQCHKSHPHRNLVRRAQEVCESRGGRPGLPVPRSPYDLCGHKATFEEEKSHRGGVGVGVGGLVGYLCDAHPKSFDLQTEDRHHQSNR